jgi:hypothetical protein
MKIFAQIKFVLLAAAVALALGLPTHAADKNGEEKEETVKLADCPAAVQKTIKDNADGGKILEVEKETKKDGTVVYAAEVKKTDGKRVEIEVAEDGKLIKVEDGDDDEDDESDEDEDEKDEK